MLREVLGVECSEEEEKVAAACIILRVREHQIALQPEIQQGVEQILRALNDVPAEWQRELALEALAITPWRVAS